MAVSILSFRSYVASLSGRRLGSFKNAAQKAGITFEEYITRVEAGLKRCTDCTVWKDRGCFSVDNSRWDGLCAKCKACSGIRYEEEYQPIPVDLIRKSGPSSSPMRDGDKLQARHLVNLDVANNVRPNPNDLHCAKCGHKGDDLRHEYHHHMGYSIEHFYDVMALCSKCHHAEH